MKNKFPIFFTWIDERKSFLKSEISINDSSGIEFKMPITTYGNIMGYNYVGIENKSGQYFIYMNSVSKKGKRINGKKIQIYKDETSENYNELVNNLMGYLATETDYLQITIGNI